MLLTEFERKQLYHLSSLAAAIFLNADEILTAAIKFRGARQLVGHAIATFAESRYAENIFPSIAGKNNNYQNSRREISRLGIVIDENIDCLVYQAVLILKNSLEVLTALDITHPLLLHTQQKLAESITKLEQISSSDN